MRNFNKAALVSLAGLAMVSSAHAEVPAAVLTAITEAGTNAGIMGAAVLVVIVGIRAFKWLRKAL